MPQSSRPSTVTLTLVGSVTIVTLTAGPNLATMLSGVIQLSDEAVYTFPSILPVPPLRDQVSRAQKLPAASLCGAAALIVCLESSAKSNSPMQSVLGTEPGPKETVGGK